jgi:hypothetical protein
MMGREMHSRIFWEIQNERYCYGGLSVDGRIILKLLLRKLYGTEWIGLLGPRLGPTVLELRVS